MFDLLALSRSLFPYSLFQKYNSDKNHICNRFVNCLLALTFCALPVLLPSFTIAQTDSLMIPKKKGLFREGSFLKQSIVPASLLVTGIVLSDSDFEDGIQKSLQNALRNDFSTSLDDRTRNIPIAQMYIADILGVQARNHWFDQTKNMVISILLTDLLTMQLKKAAGKQRPDDTDFESWPSGHTSHAFATASVLYEEFKYSSPLLAYSGYLFAATTGFLRMANNRHFFSDVLAGAGVGILVTKLVYKYDYLIPWNPFLKKNNMALLPRYSEGTLGIYFVKKF